MGGVAMCLIPKQYPERPEGWDRIEPPSTADVLFERCKALREKIEQDMEDERKRTGEYMKMLKEVVR